MNRTRCTCENPGTPCSIHKFVVFRNPDGTFSKVYILRRIINERDEMCRDDSNEILPSVRNKQRSSSLPTYMTAKQIKQDMVPRMSFAETDDHSDDHFSIASFDTDVEQPNIRRNVKYNDFSPKYSSSFKTPQHEDRTDMDAEQCTSPPIPQYSTNQANCHMNRVYHIHSKASLEAFRMACLQDGSSLTAKSILKTKTYKPRMSRIDSENSMESVQDPKDHTSYHERNCSNDPTDKNTQIGMSCNPSTTHCYEFHGFLTSPLHFCIDPAKLTHQSCNCKAAHSNCEKQFTKTENEGMKSSSGSPEFLEVAVKGLEQAMQLLQEPTESPANEIIEIADDISEINKLMTSKIDNNYKILKDLRNILAITLDDLQTTLGDDPNKSFQLTDIENKLKSIRIDDSTDGYNADENVAYNVTIQGLDKVVQLLQKSIDARYDGKLPSNLDELNRLLVSKLDRKQHDIQKLKATLGDMIKDLQSTVANNDPNKSMKISNGLTNVSFGNDMPAEYSNRSRKVTEIVDNSIKGLNQAIGLIQKSKDTSYANVLPSDLENINKILQEKLDDNEHQLDELQAAMEAIVADLRAIVDSKKYTTNNLKDFSFETSSPARESTRIDHFNASVEQTPGKETQSEPFTETQEPERTNSEEPSESL